MQSFVERLFHLPWVKGHHILLLKAAGVTLALYEKSLGFLCADVPPQSSVRSASNWLKLVAGASYSETGWGGRPCWLACLWNHHI